MFGIARIGSMALPSTNSRQCFSSMCDGSVGAFWGEKNGSFGVFSFGLGRVEGGSCAGMGGSDGGSGGSDGTG